MAWDGIEQERIFMSTNISQKMDMQQWLGMHQTETIFLPLMEQTIAGHAAINVFHIT